LDLLPGEPLRSAVLKLFTWLAEKKVRSERSTGMQPRCTFPV
jgi:hypothetical protein